MTTDISAARIIPGGPGDDRLHGGNRDDFMTGGDGADFLVGRRGEDTLVGDKGSDTMWGGAGDDRMIWNNGDGSDRMVGGTGEDVVEVNGSLTDGDNFVVATDGSEIDFARLNLIPFKLDIDQVETLEINGGGGDDTMTGSVGLLGRIKLELSGGDGSDLIAGGDGGDWMSGGRGDDTLVGNKGSDTMLGGHDDDRLIWNNGDGSDQMIGGSGVDVVEVNGSAVDGDDFVIAADGGDVDFARLNLIPFKLDISQTETLEVNGGGGDDTITGSVGLAGKIALKLSGGAGDDLIAGGDGGDGMSGGKGEDVLIGNKGADTMHGGHGDDRLIWNNGDGSDRMIGGKGEDAVEVNGSLTDGDEFVIAADGAGVDFERVNLIPFKLDISQTETLEVNGGGGGDIISGSVGLSGKIKLELSGGDGDDFVAGGDGGDWMSGGRGDDVLVGNKGSDTMLGGHDDDRLIWNNGDGSDQMIGGGGEDVVEVNGSTTDGDLFRIRADGADIDFERENLIPFKLDISQTETLEVNGGGGDDIISGSSGLDGKIRLELSGGAGDDSITGGDGGDVIYGGAGDDQMFGGAGADVFRFKSGDDLIVDFENGVDKIDLSLVAWVSSFADVSPLLSAAGGDVNLTIGGHTLNIQGASLGDFSAQDFIF